MGWKYYMGFVGNLVLFRTQCEKAFFTTGDVDAQLHGCLLSMGADQQSVTPHLTNFSAVTGATFTRRENNVSNDALRRQSMVYTPPCVACKLDVSFTFFSSAG